MPLSKTIKTLKLRVPYLLDLCRTLELCHMWYYLKGFIFVYGNNFNCTAPSNSTVPYIL